MAPVGCLLCTPLRNPFRQYSRDKIACEELLTAAYRAEGFPATIIRPSHACDRTLVPFDGGWTVLRRMRRGRPVVAHGAGRVNSFIVLPGGVGRPGGLPRLQ